MHRASLRLFAPLLFTLFLGACSDEAPPCPVPEDSREAIGASCLIVVHNRMLVVERWNGRVSPPGGQVEPGESSRCAAHRETWEETGLDLTPGPRIENYHRGYDLYQCELHADSGAVDSRDLLEVRRVFWLPLEDFETVEWRFPNQGKELRRLIQSSEPAATSD